MSPDDPDLAPGVEQRRPRLLTIMGSGETAPPMARVHRLLVERLGPPPVDMVLLDTPYGFQENTDQISQRAVDYFERNLGVTPDVAKWRSNTDDVVRREQALAQIQDAAYVFAGPGSPTYALEVWKDSRLRNVLAEKLAHGGCVTFASAAALTLGAATVPVYEIYKVGTAPHWVEGMDLLATTGLRAAVIPHYDNAEGGNHDTRFCYLGERRLRMLESMLEPGTVVLGVDEHTACSFDLDADTATVLGRGAVAVRRRGVSTLFASGCTVPRATLRRMVTRLGKVAVAGTRDPRELVSPFVDALVALRNRAREERSWALADDLRDRLVAAGIEVHDTPGGTVWLLAGQRSAL